MQAEKFDKKLAEEEVWLRQGVKARRTRNEGRVRALMAMRAERAARREQTGQVRLAGRSGERPGKLVFEAEHVSKIFGSRRRSAISRRAIMRGDRIGLIGPNGAGKTTLLRLLLGELAPDAGERAARRERADRVLRPAARAARSGEDGRSTPSATATTPSTVNGQPRHVLGYLARLSVSTRRARSPVKALSGGERNRLLLARLFTRPANVLVLDEPTNDLDIETLELLEEQLVEWPGTLLLVSHDRVFLDNVVTSTFVFDGAGDVQEYVGGYEDFLQTRAGGPGGAGRAGGSGRAGGAGGAGRAGRSGGAGRASREEEGRPVVARRL